MITIREAVRLTTTAKEKKQAKAIEKYDAEMKFISNLVTQRVVVQAALGVCSTIIVLGKKDCGHFELKNVVEAALTLKKENAIIKEVYRLGGVWHIRLNWGGTQ